MSVKPLEVLGIDELPVLICLLNNIFIKFKIYLTDQ